MVNRTMRTTLRRSIRHATQYAALPPQVRRTVCLVRRHRLSYLPVSKMLALARHTLAADREGRPGILVEVGCGLGGSAIVLASAKRPERELIVYDVFGMIPPPGERDGAEAHHRYQVILSGASRGIGRDRYYGYVDNLLDVVKTWFRRLGFPTDANNVTLVQGLVQDTLRVTEPVCFAHIDADWYEPVMVSLRRLEPHLTPGGAIVVDDYETWSGCRRAVDDYFTNKPAGLYTFDLTYGSFIAVKN